MTLSSMTGFARAQGCAGPFNVAIEMRSVNGRGLDLRFRLQPPFDGFEAEFRARAQKVLSRGSVQVALTAKRETQAALVRVNETLFGELAEVAEQLAWKAKLTQATVGDLLRLPGVIETGDARDETPDEAIQSAVPALFDEALAGLVSARRSEGRALSAIVSGQLDQMETGIRAAAEADGARPAAIRARIESQIRALGENPQNFDTDRLHQEAVLIATRMDVREEIDRFTAHIAAARQLVAAREPVGRKLDFLTQEFVREVNTLCSKANDLALTRIGLDLKAVVEQFREQIQNIE
ncbi:MAG: YicC family protein [Proteobacteria bacterium]|nr:YicC family protein [Pseudomonadota bacterium]